MNKKILDQVTIVTVTYNSGDIATALGEVLRRFPHVIIVDNASNDQSVSILAKQAAHAAIIRNDTNLGFGTANNVGVALVNTPYVLLLNPDCDISVESVESLLIAAEAYPTAAIIAPQGWHAKNVPQVSYRHAFYESRSRAPYQVPWGICSAKWLHGCCMLIRTNVFRKIGGFDENLFLYYEDDDLCLRMMSAGYECLLEPAASVFHAGGKSSAPSWKTDFIKYFYFARSRYFVIDRYLGKSAAIRYRLKIAIAAPAAILFYTLALQRKQTIKWLAWGCSVWKWESARHAPTQ